MKPTIKNPCKMENFFLKKTNQEIEKSHGVEKGKQKVIVVWSRCSWGGYFVIGNFHADHLLTQRPHRFSQLFLIAPLDRLRHPAVVPVLTALVRELRRRRAVHRRRGTLVEGLGEGLAQPREHAAQLPLTDDVSGNHVARMECVGADSEWAPVLLDVGWE